MSGWLPVSPWKLVRGSAQTVAIGATSLGSVAVGSQTRAILIYASSSCHIRITPQASGSDPAVATDTFIPGAASPLVLGCSPGDIVKVIQDSAAGTLYITELTH